MFNIIASFSEENRTIIGTAAARIDAKPEGGRTSTCAALKLAA